MLGWFSGNLGANFGDNFRVIWGTLSQNEVFTVWRIRNWYNHNPNRPNVPEIYIYPYCVLWKIFKICPKCPERPNSNLPSYSHLGALGGPLGPLEVSKNPPTPLPTKPAWKNETFELLISKSKFFLGVWRVVSMCPILLIKYNLSHSQNRLR